MEQTMNTIKVNKPWGEVRFFAADGKVFIEAFDLRQEIEARSLGWIGSKNVYSLFVGCIKDSELARKIAQVGRVPKNFTAIELSLDKTTGDKLLAIFNEVKKQRNEAIQKKQIRTWKILVRGTENFCPEYILYTRDLDNDETDVHLGYKRTKDLVQKHKLIKKLVERAQRVTEDTLEISDELVQTIINESLQEQKKSEQDIETTFCEAIEQAKQTGEKVLVQTYYTDCQDSRLECNTDIVHIWALPNGEIVEQRIHTY